MYNFNLSKAIRELSNARCDYKQISYRRNSEVGIESLENDCPIYELQLT